MEEQKHLTAKEIKDFNKFVSSLYSKIEHKIDNIDWTHYASNLFDICLKESKEHDRFRSDGIKRGITVYNEAKYFTCLWLIRYTFDFVCFKPSVKDYLSTKESLFYAYSIALNYGDKIKEVISLDEANKINSVDYLQLI